MAIWNQHWYDINAGRTYPIDETATALTDSGIFLPHDILVDMLLKFPSSLGTYVFLSSVYVSSKLVTLTFQASDSLGSPSSLVPVAVISLPQPIDINRIIPLDPQYPGVAGHVIFGPGAAVDGNPFSGRFSSPSQSRITTKALRRYADPPVKSLSLPHSLTKLTGLVNLIAQAPLEIVKEAHEIDNVLRDVAVIRLVQPATQTDSIFQEFTGPCGGRPESGTCVDEAIEFINNVAPDCLGTITLEIGGDIHVSAISDNCETILTGVHDLDDTCKNALQLPDATGRLPTDRDLACEPISISEGDQGGGGPPITWPPVTTSISLDVIGSLPYTDTFDDCRANNFVVQTGHWNYVQDDSPDEIRPDTLAIGPSYCGNYSSLTSACLNEAAYSAGLCDLCYATETFAGASYRNISLWKSFDDTTVCRQVSTDLKIQIGPAGSRKNGGIVLNHKPHPTQVNRYTYFLVLVDCDALQLKVAYFNGSTLAPLSTVTLPELQTGVWYRLVATTLLNETNPARVDIVVQLNAITGPSLSATVGPITVSNYLPGDGWNGLYTDRSYTRFSFWHVDTCAPLQQGILTTCCGSTELPAIVNGFSSGGWNATDHPSVPLPWDPVEGWWQSAEFLSADLADGYGLRTYRLRFFCDGPSIDDFKLTLFTRDENNILYTETKAASTGFGNCAPLTSIFEDFHAYPNPSTFFSVIIQE